jgi:flavin-binding protein dodecin
VLGVNSREARYGGKRVQGHRNHWDRPESWASAGKAAVERASKTLRDLRVAEVVEQDIQIKNGKVELYRVKLSVSFKFEDTDKH